MSDTRIHVANIPVAITQQELLALFVPFGNIKSLSPSLKLQSKFARDARQSDPQAPASASASAAETSYCEVEYEELDDAVEAAANMNGFELYGKFLIATKRGAGGAAGGSGSGVLGRLADRKAVWDEENSGLLQQ